MVRERWEVFAAIGLMTILGYKTCENQRRREWIENPDTALPSLGATAWGGTNLSVWFREQKIGQGLVVMQEQPSFMDTLLEDNTDIFSIPEG